MAAVNSDCARRQCALAAWNCASPAEVRRTARTRASSSLGPICTQPASSSGLRLRVSVVRSAAQRAIKTLLARCSQNGYTIRNAVLVVGSQIDPDAIANPHIRAHAFEGQLFRCVLERALQRHHIYTEVVMERDAYSKAAVELKQSTDELRRVIQDLGRASGGPWRAEQKLAALAAWLALR